MFADYYSVSLPSEAEWEYVARAGQQLEYPTNDGTLSYSQANYGTGFGGPSGQTYLTPVGTLFPPNPYGLYNMTGNVSEWCLDWYDTDFFQLCVDSNYCCNPINNNVPSVEVKVLKGGNHTYPGPFAMSSHRFDTPPFVTTDHMGFRVVTRSVSIDIGVEYQSDWNLVGLPLEVEDASYNLIFPESIEGTLYSFDGGYNLETSLIQGEGYWLRFNEAGSTTITGTPMNEITISLNEGWNLISGLSEDISIYSVLDPDSIIVSGTLYGFGGGYIETDMLVPGRGYWIRANNSGNITLTSE